MGKHNFQPDYAVHPGEILKEWMDANGETQRQMAIRTGLSHVAIGNIIRQEYGLTAKMCLKLEKVTGVSVSIWIRTDADYRLAKARRTNQCLEATKR